jgi:hypothetical protein
MNFKNLLKTNRILYFIQSVLHVQKLYMLLHCISFIYVEI